jgi:hypothetical protein
MEGSCGETVARSGNFQNFVLNFSVGIPIALLYGKEIRLTFYSKSERERVLLRP